MMKAIRYKGFGGMRKGVVLFAFAGLNYSCPAMLRIDITAPPYNAVPNDGLDDSPAFQAAIDAMLASTPRGGYLYVPDGDYHFDSQVYAYITGKDAEGLTIQGQSTAGTRLICNNTNGVIWLNHFMRFEDDTVRDLTFVANRAGAGTALRINSTPGGQQSKKVVTLLNLAVTYAAGSSNYFNTGLAVRGVQRPIIKNCSVAAPTTDVDMSDTSPNFLPDFGIVVGDCYSPEVQNCSVPGAYTAYSMVMSGTSDQEDDGFFNCTANYCGIGMVYHIPNNSRAGFQ
ncbi:MAG: glycoside hydrolase family 55 protein, partial [Kiritimatiellales bacterium]|nr:glycoside hydrolase family 55 protein [Kiritimatiellales bacterium]